MKHDSQHLIKLVDIYSEEFTEVASGITQESALSIIHGIYKNNIITGIDVNYLAWTFVGKKYRVMLFKVPITRQFAKLAYRLFAYYRHPISFICSKLFKLEASACTTGYCYREKTSNHRR